MEAKAARQQEWDMPLWEHPGEKEDPSITLQKGERCRKPKCHPEEGRNLRASSSPWVLPPVPLTPRARCPVLLCHPFPSFTIRAQPCRQQNPPLRRANKWPNNCTGTLQHHFSNRFSSRLAFTVQLSLPLLYSSSVMHHPLKKRGKPLKPAHFRETALNSTPQHKMAPGGLLQPFML